jgi:hypothetical protein
MGIEMRMTVWDLVLLCIVLYVICSFRDDKDLEQNSCFCGSRYDHGIYVRQTS